MPLTTHSRSRVADALLAVTRGLVGPVGIRVRVATATLTVVALALVALPMTAGAVVEEVSGTKVGLQPREVSRYWGGYGKWNGLGSEEANVPAEKFGNDPNRANHPGPVLHSASTYVIYWDPQDYYHGDWQSTIDGFMANLGSSGGQLSNVFAVDTQYTDGTDVPATSHSVFHGAYTDTNPYPVGEACSDPHASLTDWGAWKVGVPLTEANEPFCLTDRQIRAQLETFIDEQHGIQKGMGTIFYLLTPPGVTVCLDGGGISGHCSDFDGSVTEITEYEEAERSYTERVPRYPQEKAAYEEAKEKYEEEKSAKEGKGEKDEEKPPVAPIKPVAPTVPASYADYTNSFCGYHSDISPTNLENGNASSILYSVIPWTAGGNGDYHLSGAEANPGYDCQDGGFEPGTKPSGELEEKEHAKARTPKEEEEFQEKSPKERREEEEAIALGLEEPHEQEPNQLGSARGDDGSYDEGLPDLIINQIAVEQQNTVTDPLLNAWQDPVGNEVTDECRNSFYPTTDSASANPETRAGTLSNQLLGGGKYYLNDTFNGASRRLPYPGVPCMNSVTLEPKFTAPNPVNSGEIVGLDGMESDITLDSAISFSPSGAVQKNYATYTWNFGDGSPEVSGYSPGAPSQNSPAASPCAEPWLTPCAASTYHSYEYGGTYNVTLTVKDVGGNTGSVTKPITVVGPPPPSPAPSNVTSGGGAPSGGGALATGAAGGGGKVTGSPQGPTVTEAPVLSDVVESTSLKKVKSSGLAVRYTVNEQVAGSLQVLLESAVAKRLGIHGPAATGLAKGSRREIVIGTAVLVTTKAGRGTIRIKFSSKTAARMARSHRLKLTLRLTVRNASRQSPQTSTVLSTVVLSR